MPPSGYDREVASHAARPGVPVEIEREGATAILRLTRPDERNVLGTELLEALVGALRSAEADPSIRCIVITGSGRAFAAGADIRAILEDSLEQNLAYNAGIVGAFDAVELSPLPSIAAINGHALGGGLELALACTFRIAVPEARLGCPEVKLGILPGAGGLVRLPRLIGYSRALRLLVTGDPVGAADALAAGLVDEVVPQDSLMDAALALASRIGANAPLAVRAIRTIAREGVGRTAAESTARTESLLLDLLRSSDKREGMTAFLEKRPPAFAGA